MDAASQSITVDQRPRTIDELGARLCRLAPVIESPSSDAETGDAARSDPALPTERGHVKTLLREFRCLTVLLSSTLVLSIWFQGLLVLEGWSLLPGAYAGEHCGQMRSWLLESILSLTLLKTYGLCTAMQTNGTFILSAYGIATGPLALLWAAWGAVVRHSSSEECSEIVPGIWELVDEMAFLGLCVCCCSTLGLALTWTSSKRLRELHSLFGTSADRADSDDAVVDGATVATHNKPMGQILGRIALGPLRRVGSDQTCVICLQDCQDGDELWRKTHCGHYFHDKCLTEWIKREQKCPLCRAEFVIDPA